MGKLRLLAGCALLLCAGVTPCPATQEGGDSSAAVVIDFGRCVPERRTVAFSRGSTTYEVLGSRRKRCVLKHGTEIENPLWDGRLGNTCSVPRRVGKLSFKVRAGGVDFSPLRSYCKMTPAARP